MSRVRYEEFFPDVLPYVPDCPDTVAAAAIRDTCIEFCEMSLWLRETLERDDIEAGEAEYPLASPNGCSIVMALSAVYRGKTILPTTPEFLEGLYGANWWEREGTPIYFIQQRPEAIRFTPIPDEDVTEGWYATVAVKPKHDSTVVAKSLLEHWHEAIGFGARARIHEIPNQPFSNEAAAQRLRAWFVAKCNEARAQTRQGVGRAPLRVKFKPFGV